MRALKLTDITLHIMLHVEQQILIFTILITQKEKYVTLYCRKIKQYVNLSVQLKIGR